MSGPSPRCLLALLLVAALLLPMSLFSDDAEAQGIDETLVDDWVETQYNITFTSFSEINVDVNFDIFEADLGLATGTPASVFRSHLADDPELQKEYLEAAERDLRDTINGTLGSLDLKNATVQVYPASVRDIGENVSGDIYRDPVRLGTGGKVVINPACLQLPATSSVDKLVKGTLNMGGTLNLSVEIRAKAGHMNRFHVVPPAGFYFKAGLALTSTRDLSIDARNSTTELSQKTYLALVSANPAKLAERIDANAAVDVKELDDARFAITISIYAVDATRFSPHFPAILGIYLVSADGMRMGVQEGLLTWDDIYAYSVDAQVHELETQLASILDGPLKLDFSWDGTSLEGYDHNTMTGRPVKATLTGNGSLDMKGMSEHVAEDALWSGAKVPFEIAVYNNMNWNVVMTLPRNITIVGSGLAPSGYTDGREIFSWNKAFNPLRGDLARNTTWVPERNGTVNIKLEIKDVDYDLAKILGQRRTSAKFKVSVSIAVESLPINADIQAALPAGVEIDRANADLMRALLAEGLVNRSEIDTIVNDLSTQMTLQLSTALGKDVDFRVFVDEPTLGANATGPITLKGSASVTVTDSIDAKDSIASFIDVAKEFYLEGRSGWRAVYTIQLPQGIEIFKVERTLNNSAFKEPPSVSKDKRSYVEVLEGDLSDNVTLYVRPTFEKTVAVTIVQPLCFGPIILIVVVIVVVVYLLRVRKRRALARSASHRGHPPHAHRHHAHPHHVQGRRPAPDPGALERSGEHLEGMHKLQPHVHKYHLPLKQWKSDEDTDYEELPATTPPHAVKGHITSRPPPTQPGKASVPLAQPKPYLPPKPAPATAPRHVTGSPEKFVKCPACGRRFGIHPEEENICCPHCGKKGRTGPRKPHITGAPAVQSASRTKAIKCPRCGNNIVYGEDQEAIRCGVCGKEGKIKRKA